ncbi:hypothetical protein Tco_1512214, partial [Tanacetum coccineum]
MDRDSKTTKFTYCCRVRFGSVNQARRALRQKAIRINGIYVMVGPYEDGFKVERGDYKLELSNWEFRSGPQGASCMTNAFSDSKITGASYNLGGASIYH